MRLWLALVILVAATARAGACPSADIDDVASGGPSVVEVSDERGAFKYLTYTVPSRPSLYFHRGSEDRRPPTTFTDGEGRPVAFVPVYTGLAEYPLRFDFAIESGTIIESKNAHLRYEIVPGMTPRTRSVAVERHDDFFEIQIDSDAALLRFEAGDETWVLSGSPRFSDIFGSLDLRITAFYSNGTEEVIFEPRPAPLESHAGLLALALFGMLGWVGLLRLAAPRAAI